MKRLGELVPSDLARGIWRLRLQGMILVDRHTTRGPVDLARRRVHNESASCPLRGTEDVGRTHGVRMQVGERRLVRERDRDERCEVEDGIDARARGSDAVRVAHVAEYDLELVAPRRAVQPSPGAEGVVLHKGADARAELDETLAEMAADEAACSGHENPPPRPRDHSCSTSVSACS